jgi:myo-inositol-1(or 4)-monophosphatase
MDSLFPQIEQIIREAGAFAREEFLNFSRKHIEYKGTNDLFSYVDVETEKKLKDSFRELLPGAGFINEEGANEEGSNAYRWIIDPIDGTTNFTHGVPLFAICVALQKSEETIMGFVYEVAHDEMFAAQKGKGATCNGEPIQVSGVKQLSKSLVATGFPYTNFSWMDDYMRMLTDFMQASHGLRRLGSAAIDLVYVASGRFEGFFEFGLNSWDVAAGGLIVQEAGGRVTDFEGKDNFIFGKELVASNGAIHDEMMEVVKARVKF